MTDSPRGGLRPALGFLTVVGGSSAPSAAAMTWFPVVGAAVGGVVGAVWWAAGEIWPALLAATVAVVADLVLTGALHHDGLADAADGLLPHMERERRLVVMRQPDIGTFGVMALASTTLLRVGALAAVEPRPLVLAGVWGASRAAMAVIALRLPYARGSGIASGFLGASILRIVVVALVVAVPLAILGDGARGAAALVAVGVGAALVAAIARRRIGGFTGDVLGAAGLVGETAGLLTMAARW